MNNWWNENSGRVGILIVLLGLTLARNPHWIGFGTSITFSMNESCILGSVDGELKEVGSDWRIVFSVGDYTDASKREKTFKLPNKGLYTLKYKNQLFKVWKEETIKVTGKYEVNWCPNC